MDTTTAILIVALALVLVLSFAVGIALVVTARGLRRVRSELDSLRARVEPGGAAGPEPGLRSHPGPPGDLPVVREYVITDLAPRPTTQAGAPLASREVDAERFGKVLAAESAIRVAAVVHGVRRAMAADTRHRIAFEMRREVRRARKRRRRDLREARRRPTREAA